MRRLVIYFVLITSLPLALVASASLLADEVDNFRPAPPEEAATTAQSPSIGSWLNTPPDRQFVAFDAYFNRLYFGADGRVVGRYNRAQKKFQAGEFRPAQWHNIADRDTTSTAAKVGASPTAPATSESRISTTGSYTTPYPIVPFPHSASQPTEPEPAQPKPVEVFRRGQSTAGSGSKSRVRVIEGIKP